MMKKILYITIREFLATVMTKGFLIGVLLTPALLVIVIAIVPRFVTNTPPRIEGQVAVVDPTGDVAGKVAEYLTPEQFVERRIKARQQLRDLASSEAGERAAGIVDRSQDVKPGDMPSIEVVTLPAGADLEREKAPLKSPLSKREGTPSTRLALVVIHHDAVHQDPVKKEFGSYDLFVRNKLDDRLIDDIQAGVQEAIGSARLRASGFNPGLVEDLMKVKRAQARTVTAGGEQKSNRMLNFMLPVAFMVLLLASVFTSAGSLLGNTIEEKSSRVVEILLSAASAMELMTGKILGQMTVGLVILFLYAGLGIVALTAFALMGLFDPMLLVYLFIFFILSYFTVAALMAAIGSAVSDMRDAQSLMMPVMMIMIIPWLLMVPISSQPNSALAVTLSFVPPVGSFVTLMRMASNSPPAMWQAWLAILVSAAGAYAALRFSARIFRIGLLMFGKPPTFGTLIRWARMSN